MGACYTKEAYEQLVGRLEEQKKLKAELETGNAELQAKVNQLIFELESQSQVIEKLERTLQEALDTNETVRNEYEIRIQQLEWNFHDTISKLCDMQIAELTNTEKSDKSPGINTKTTATQKSLPKKFSRRHPLRKLFAKKPSSDTQVSELKKKVRVLEMDQKRQLHRKENELTEKERELKRLEMSNRELQEAVPTPCAICLEGFTNCTFLPCGHLCTCMECGKQVLTCPLCRSWITSRVKVFQN